jgi:hypothetical protein
MCDFCGDPECRADQPLTTNELMLAAAGRVDALFQAVNPDVEAVNNMRDLEGEHALRAVALAWGVPLDDLASLLEGRVGGVLGMLWAGTPAQDVIVGVTLQAWAYGWLVRDEQLKAAHELLDNANVPRTSPLKGTGEPVTLTLDERTMILLRRIADVSNAMEQLVLAVRGGTAGEMIREVAR